jgi:hypothetical protein
MRDRPDDSDRDQAIENQLHGDRGDEEPEDLSGGASTIHTASTSKITPPAMDRDPIVKCNNARSCSPSTMSTTATVAAVIIILRSTRCLAAGSSEAVISADGYRCYSLP